MHPGPTTQALQQDRTPIVDSLRKYLEERVYPFHTPGHKGGRFAPPQLVELWGEAVFRLDLPAMTATDSLLHPTGCIAEAQALAAELYGAAETFYLTGGSTQGIAAMLLATVQPGGTIVLARSVHRSVPAALVLAGAVPRFVAVDVLPHSGAQGPNASDVARALLQSPLPEAVLVTRPTYYGMAYDLQELASVCHSRNVPLLVDEAHGAHLPMLLPAGPPPALAQGADAVVQSCHKTLGAMVGSAQLHVAHDRFIEPDRIRRSLNLLQTTSPSFLQLASLDAVRRQMAQGGSELFQGAAERAAQISAEISNMPGISVLDAADNGLPLDCHLDPLRLVVHVAPTGWTGYDVELLLRTEYQVEDELSDPWNIVLVMSPYDDPAAMERLVNGLRYVAEHPRSVDKHRTAWPATISRTPLPRLAMTPREAALGPTSVTPITSGVGSVCAETIAFYPPGIPTLIPGEEIDAVTVEMMQQQLAAGAQCYAHDTTLATVVTRS